MNVPVNHVGRPRHLNAHFSCRRGHQNRKHPFCQRFSMADFLDAFEFVRPRSTLQKVEPEIEAFLGRLMRLLEEMS